MEKISDQKQRIGFLIDNQPDETFSADNFTIVRPQYVLLTINPRPETTVTDLLQLYSRIRKKKWIYRTYGHFEWRGIDTGLHLHSVLFCKPNKPKCHMHREIYNTVKNHVGNKKHVHLIVNKESPDNFITYVKGWKGGLRKPTYKYDLIMRKKYCMLLSNLEFNDGTFIRDYIAPTIKLLEDKEEEQKKSGETPDQIDC